MNKVPSFAFLLNFLCSREAYPYKASNSQLETGESLIKLSIAGIITAVKTMQLVQARNGVNDRKINEVFQEEDLEILKI